MVFDNDTVRKSGLNQGEVAKILRVSRVTVNNWARGKFEPTTHLTLKVKNLMLLLNRAINAGSLPLHNVKRDDRGSEIKQALLRHTY